MRYDRLKKFIGAQGDLSMEEMHRYIEQWNGLLGPRPAERHLRLVEDPARETVAKTERDNGPERSAQEDQP